MVERVKMKENSQIGASKTRRTLWNLSLVLSSSVCHTGAFLLAIIWHLDIILYIVVGFIVSCLLGAMAVDIKKSIVFTYVSMAISSVAATAIFLAPHALFSRSAAEFDFAAIAVFTVMGKIILIGLIAYFLGALLGSFIGEKSIER